MHWRSFAQFNLINRERSFAYLRTGRQFLVYYCGKILVNVLNDGLTMTDRHDTQTEPLNPEPIFLMLEMLTPTKQGGSKNWIRFFVDSSPLEEVRWINFILFVGWTSSVVSIWVSVASYESKNVCLCRCLNENYFIFYWNSF